MGRRATGGLWALWLVVAGAWAATLAGQGVTPGATPGAAGKATEAAAPVLSETDRLRLVVASQAVEIATLKVQTAAGELQRARGEWDRLVGVVTPAGWVLNDRLELVKAPKGDK